MGCGGSTSNLPAREAQYGTHEDALKLYSPTRLAVADDRTISSSVTPEHLAAWKALPSQRTLAASKKKGPRRAHRSHRSIREEVWLQTLAVDLGRDPCTGMPRACSYISPTTDIAASDGSHLSRLETRFQAMLESDDLQSDGRVTPEPGELSCVFSSTIRSVQAKFACRSHRTDVEELMWINQSCPEEVEDKIHDWDGVFSIGVDALPACHDALPAVPQPPQVIQSQKSPSPIPSPPPIQPPIAAFPSTP